MALLDALGGLEEGEALVRVVHAEALRATGDDAGARAAIRAAKARLDARAAKLEDPALERSFRTRVPENARTLELAAELDPEG
jgi:eukaryotic-like serine/threonine-protein kinase